MLSEKLMEVLDRIQGSIRLEPKHDLAYAIDGNVALFGCPFCINQCSDGCRGTCHKVCHDTGVVCSENSCWNICQDCCD